MSNLFEHFDCETKEELYQKVREDDLSVRSLVDFIEYSKMDMDKVKQVVRSPESFVEIMKNELMPDRNETICMFVNTKNQPVHISRIEHRMLRSVNLALKEGLDAGAVNVLFLGGSQSIPYQKDLIDHFRTIGLETLDLFLYKDNETIQSIQETKTYYLDDYGKNVSEINTSYCGSANVHEKFPSYDGYEDFSSYFSEQEMLGVNVFKDVQQVKEALKVGYQYDWQESFGVISCDKEGNITSVKELFKGSPNASIIDMKVVAKELLSDVDTTQTLVFHNHPSGVPEPSDEDRQVTKQLTRATDYLNIELLDHMIVGKERVLSFAEEMEASINYNQPYNESLQNDSVKRKQMSFDFGR